MSIKKKGTPEKIKVVADASLLEKFKKLIEKATSSDTPVVNKSKQNKGK